MYIHWYITLGMQEHFNNRAFSEYWTVEGSCGGLQVGEI